jgi:U4/U6 small nuclear ribonucleoprotein PRP4
MHLIPAHSNLITHLRYDPANSDYILTSSFDGTAKVWSTTNIGFCAKVLKGTSNKMMYADVRQDSGRIVTCSYDRTFKIWSPQGKLGDDEDEPVPAGDKMEVDG